MKDISSTEYRDIMSVLMEIKSDIGGINSHLKTLNGSVARHEQALLNHTKDMKKLEDKTNNSIAKIKSTMNKFGGGLAVFLFILQAILVSTPTVS